MITKDDLRQYRSMVEEIKELDAERENIRDLATRTTSSYSITAGRGGKVKGLDYYIAGMADIDEIIAAKIIAQAERRRMLEEAVEKLPTDERRAIRYYYFQALPKWDHVAAAMHMSTRTVLRLHGAALVKLMSF